MARPTDEPPEDVTASPTIAAIVPATGEPPTLDRCLEAIRSGSSPPDELMVITEPRGAGPALARNQGASRADADVLVFVDADVLVHPDAIARIRAAFAADPSLTALFGSYDDSPEAPGAISGFRNLLHHHVHQAAAGRAMTFWAGLGAVRRDAFLAAGGFDAERYPVPSIEDIELGIRLSANGARIVLDPEVQGTHLKGWTLAGMLRTDLVHRGIPWVGVLLEPGASRETLNLGWRHRVSAAASLVGVAGIALRRPRMAAIGLVALVLLNRSLYALVWRRRGPLEAVAAVPIHGAHHLVGVVAALVGLATHGRRRRGGRGSAAGQGELAHRPSEVEGQLGSLVEAP